MALDIKEIQELIKFVAKSGVSEVDLEMGEMKISIKTPPKKGKGQVEGDAKGQVGGQVEGEAKGQVG